MATTSDPWAKFLKETENMDTSGVESLREISIAIQAELDREPSRKPPKNRKHLIRDFLNPGI